MAVIILALASTPFLDAEESRINGQIAPSGNSNETVENYSGDLISSGMNCSYCMRGEGLLPCHVKRGNLFYFDGWVEGGAVSNNMPPITTSAEAGDPSYPGNESAESFQLNQIYGIMGIDAQRNPNAIGLGGRVDILYGTDYLMTSAVGLESNNYRRATAGGGPAESVYEAAPRWSITKEGSYPQYGVALPQAYGEVYLPFLAGTSIKFGHFYSPLGYESVMSPYNFFYTHSYSMLYGEAKTLTGGLLTQKLNDYWSLLFGINRGWDTWEGYENDTSFLAGFKWANAAEPENVSSSISFAIQNGKQIYEADLMPGASNYTVKEGDMFNYSLVYQQKLGPNLQYVLQHDLGTIENGSYSLDMRSDEIVKRSNAYWYSVTNYLFYQINETLAIGTRFEWFQDDGHARWLANPSPTEVINNRGNVTRKMEGDNYYNVALGLNWKPTRWITIRPEVRYDWSDYEYKFYNSRGNYLMSKYAYKDGTKKELVTVGGDFIVRF